MKINISSFFFSLFLPQILIQIFQLHYVSAQSPYSRFLIGDKIYNGSVRQAGMGRIGTTLFSNTDINFKNPACLQGLNLTTLEVGVYIGGNELSTKDQSEKFYTGGVHYFGMAFPLSNSWVSGISMLPYSTVKYKDASREKFNVDSMFVDYQYSGNGGISRLGWANGIKLAEYLSVGVNTSFIFGSIVNETISSLRDSTGAEKGFFTSAVSRRINLRDFTVDAGLHIHKETGSNKIVNAGLTYNFGKSINSRQHLTYDLRNYSGGVFSRDTAQKDLEGTIKIPSGFNGGLSFEKKHKYIFAMEYNQEFWSEFRNYEEKDSSADGNTVSLGFEWTPDFTAVGNYFNRMSYRAGTWFGKSPILINGVQLPEFGINFGLSFPMVKSLSGIQTGFEYSQRGTTEKDLILEKMYRIYVGFSFNEKWFVRPKVD